MQIVTRRIGTIVSYGNSKYLMLRPELEDLNLEIGDQVAITLEQSNDNKRVIVIEKLNDVKQWVFGARQE